MRAHLDMEISVLRTIMVADSNAEALLRRLTQEHFTCPEFAQIFVAIEAMYEKAGRVPDHQTVMNADQFQDMSGEPRRAATRSAGIRFGLGTSATACVPGVSINFLPGCSTSLKGIHGSSRRNIPCHYPNSTTVGFVRF